MTRPKPNEIEELKRQIMALTKRVSDLEQVLEERLEIGSGWESEAEALPRKMSRSVVPEPVSVPVVEMPVDEHLDVKAEAPTELSSEKVAEEPIADRTVVTDSKKDDLEKPDSLESRIGLYWLNRLGIASLVIGVALFIVYSFQTWGAAVKIAMGILAGGALIVGGEWFERKRDQDTSEAVDRIKYWGLGLIGGGWSILYFTAFAAYHIPDVKMLSNLFIEELILTGLCAGAVWHACERKSQTVATFAVSLSFVTIAFSQISAASICWLLVLACGAYILSVFKQWPKLLMWTTICGWATYFLIISPKMPATGLGNPWAVQTLGALTLFWIVCNAGLLAMKEENDDTKGRLVVATGFNGMSYAFVGTQILTYLQANVEFNYLMPLVTGALYTASYQFAQKRKLVSIANMHLILGLSLLTLSVPMICHAKEIFNMFWLVELAILVYVGLKYNNPAIRWFAALLSLVCFVSTCGVICVTDKKQFLTFQYSEPFLHALVAATVYGACAQMYRQYKGKVHPSGQTLYALGFLFFSWASPIIGTTMLFENSKAQQLATLLVVWLVEYSTFVWLGHKLNERVLRMAAGAGFMCMGFVSFMVEAPYTFTQVLLSLGFLGAAIYSHKQRVTNKDEARSAYKYYITTGAIFTWLHTLNIAGSGMEFLALRWAGEAAVLVGVGHLLRDRYTRILGALWFLNTFFVMMLQLGKWNAIEDAMITVILYLMAFAYRKVPVEHQIGNERRIAHYYDAMGTTVATFAIWALVPGEWLTLAFALEGIVLLSAGFMVPDKAFRVSGLIVFALLAFKLLFIDLSTARTDARILSFIIAGVILLGASYIYAKYAQRLLKESGPESSSESSSESKTSE